MIYGIAFKNKIANVLTQTKLIDKKFVISYETFEKVLQEIEQTNPKYIIGLGAYSGIDKDSLRIETICKNKFRNNPINNNCKTEHFYTISNFVKLVENTRLTTKMGNGECNYISYKIAELIKQKNLNTKYAFIHAPQSYNPNLAAKKITSILQNW